MAVCIQHARNPGLASDPRLPLCDVTIGKRQLLAQL
jgi:hypothetical protein